MNGQPDVFVTDEDYEQLRKEELEARFTKLYNAPAVKRRFVSVDEMLKYIFRNQAEALEEISKEAISLGYKVIICESVKMDNTLPWIKLEKV